MHYLIPHQRYDGNGWKCTHYECETLESEERLVVGYLNIWPNFELPPPLSRCWHLLGTISAPAFSIYPSHSTFGSPVFPLYFSCISPVLLLYFSIYPTHSTFGSPVFLLYCSCISPVFLLYFSIYPTHSTFGSPVFLLLHVYVLCWCSVAVFARQHDRRSPKGQGLLRKEELLTYAIFVAIQVLVLSESLQPKTMNANN